MELEDALNQRKSVRSYTGEPATPEQLEAVLTAAYEAPIGMGKYDSIHLTVVTRRSLLDAIDAAAARLFGNPELTRSTARRRSWWFRAAARATSPAPTSPQSSRTCRSRRSSRTSAAATSTAPSARSCRTPRSSPSSSCPRASLPWARSSSGRRKRGTRRARSLTDTASRRTSSRRATLEGSASYLPADRIQYDPFALDAESKQSPTEYFVAFLWAGHVTKTSSPHDDRKIIFEQLSSFPKGQRRI